ncbi:hypothetical protein HYN56_03360 [Flavobacterium crocinum]|uniref:NAD(+)--protein-arginine ADP-ribosyltransferase n=1 Tax=Flavobacterium crocinum TaxID=2183896 RepID=A0A2S1YH24_9FLAO|nr:ADP-ribosyltransferase domain-containing protein [Flavobacterium crocinum]AWK03308.1 hypothetical protein HYN56_03360 [Flavobacterium crocinum]
MDEKLQKYVEEKLTDELSKIINSSHHNHITQLNEFEKTIIYHYTDYGYDYLNKILRDGGSMPEFGRYLNSSLNKLESFKALCYRAIICNRSDLQKYYDAFANGSVVVEKSFWSCSKSKLIAWMFSESPLFIIISKRGKDIEKISKFGGVGAQNEKEVLFMSGSKFKVLEIEEKVGRITITLEEV